MKTFRALHAPGEFLILPNAWDAGSARLIESAGAAAIATSSAAVAWAHGYPDGNFLPPPLLVRTIESIKRAINIPLSVDCEGGYSDDPKIVEGYVFDFVNAGAVGINIEDGGRSPDLLCAKIEAAKRAARYRDAGADGIFVPRIAEANDIENVARGIDPMPLNVMAIPHLASAEDLRRLGARRLSAGVAVARAAISLTLQLATDFLRDGDSDAVYRHITDKTNMNSLFS